MSTDKYSSGRLFCSSNGVYGNMSPTRQYSMRHSPEDKQFSAIRHIPEDKQFSEIIHSPEEKQFSERRHSPEDK